MIINDRRAFLRQLGGAAIAASFPASIQRALAVQANNVTGTIQDIEHVVVLMQENRSFDHYFGSLRGVRGFDDPTAVRLSTGNSVWYQPNGKGGFELPFHPTANNLGLQFLEDLPHNWSDTHDAWNQGQYDQWIANKGRSTMAFMKRQDIPFHYALADAFTVCDAYYCSFMGATDPNRYHMWTGWVGNDGKGGGPVINNAEEGYDWSTYPEKLEAAGVSWKIYQDSGVGLDGPGFWGWTSDPYIGNYGDNSLLYFHQYQNAQPGSALYEKARRGTKVSAGGTLFDILAADVANNALPQVSWIVAPEAFSEHGNWPSNYGAWYVSNCLDALTANPAVWAKTALFIMFDENDGFFDHLVPPTPPQTRDEGLSTIDASNEIYPGSQGNASGPYGLGVRVPMIVVSPWTKGGFVCSEVFDHTSLIRFLERRFGIVEPNITNWRRTVCGDLTSAFDFSTPDAQPVALPSTAGYVPPDHNRHPDYVPVPSALQGLPSQEPGQRNARALPYALDATGVADKASSKFFITFSNTGTAGACFHVRSGSGKNGPWTYTVGAGKSVTDSWVVPKSNQGKYDLLVYGPNGFFRAFQGSLTGGHAELEIENTFSTDATKLGLAITNRGETAHRISVADAYTGRTEASLIAPGATAQSEWTVAVTTGWYDLRITSETDPEFGHQLAGHIENGKASLSDPAIGAPRRTAEV